MDQTLRDPQATVQANVPDRPETENQPEVRG